MAAQLTQPVGEGVDHGAGALVRNRRLPVAALARDREDVSEKISGTDLDAFLAGWLKTPGKPALG